MTRPSRVIALTLSLLPATVYRRVHLNRFLELHPHPLVVAHRVELRAGRATDDVDRALIGRGRLFSFPFSLCHDPSLVKRPAAHVGVVVADEDQVDPQFIEDRRQSILYILAIRDIAAVVWRTVSRRR